MKKTPQNYSKKLPSFINEANKLPNTNCVKIFDRLNETDMVSKTSDTQVNSPNEALQALSYISAKRQELEEKSAKIQAFNSALSGMLAEVEEQLVIQESEMEASADDKELDFGAFLAQHKPRIGESNDALNSCLAMLERLDETENQINNILEEGL